MDDAEIYLKQRQTVLSFCPRELTVTKEFGTKKWRERG